MKKLAITLFVLASAMSAQAGVVKFGFHAAKATAKFAWKLFW